MNIFITGEHGYIGGHLEDALTAAGHRCARISLRGGAADLNGLGEADAIIHCAALVHSREDDPGRFYRINTELTAELAEKAKKEGVRLFVFMSTMAVYGVSDSLKGITVIGANTPLNPVTFYGKSKLAAEQKLQEMADRRFRVYILRLPMVYGAGAPGNYGRLCRLVRLTPVFPQVANKRSMIGIGHLQNYMRKLLENDMPDELDNTPYTRIFYPQDPAPVCTSDLAAGIAAGLGKKLILSPALGRLVLLLPAGPVRKLFGSLVYADSLTGLEYNPGPPTYPV